MKKPLTVKWADRIINRVNVVEIVSPDLLDDYYDHKRQKLQTSALDDAIDNYDCSTDSVMAIINALPASYPHLFEGKTVTAVNEVCGPNLQTILYQVTTYLYNIPPVLINDLVLGIHVEGSDTPFLAIILPDGDAPMPLVLLSDTVDGDLKVINTNLDKSCPHDTLRALNFLLSSHDITNSAPIHIGARFFNAKIWKEVNAVSLLEMAGLSFEYINIAECNFAVECFTAGIKYRIKATYNIYEMGVKTDSIPVDISLIQYHHNHQNRIELINNLK